MPSSELIGFKRSLSFVFHLRKLKPPLSNISFDFRYISSASSLDLTLQDMSSAYSRLKILTTSGLSSLNKETCRLMVAPNIEGDGLSPNAKRAHQNCTTEGFSFLTSSYHRKRNESRSAGLIPICKNAFSISAVRATG